MRETEKESRNNEGGSKKKKERKGTLRYRE
jgi:hypothetical protein